MSGITAQEAFNRLDSITTKEELLSLINEISIESSGTKTALYSGYSKDDPLLNSLINDSDIRLINKTETATFLSSIDIDERSDPNYNNGQKLLEKIKDIFGDSPIDRDSTANKFLYSTNDGVWDDLSKRFVLGGSGELRKGDRQL